MHADAALIRATVDELPAPVIVVAHSYGGIPTTQGLAGVDHVARFVYLTSFQLDVGSSLMSSIGGWAPGWWKFNDSEGYMSVDHATEAFVHDCSPELAGEAAQRLQLQSIVSFQASEDSVHSEPRAAIAVGASVHGAETDEKVHGYAVNKVYQGRTRLPARAWESG